MLCSTTSRVHEKSIETHLVSHYFKFVTWTKRFEKWRRTKHKVECREKHTSTFKIKTSSPTLAFLSTMQLLSIMRTHIRPHPTWPNAKNSPHMLMPLYTETKTLLACFRLNLLLRKFLVLVMPSGFFQNFTKLLFTDTRMHKKHTWSWSSFQFPLAPSLLQGEWRSPCPFHNSRPPSSLYPRKTIWLAQIIQHN